MVRLIDLDEMLENQKIRHSKNESEYDEAYIDGWTECLQSIDKHEPKVKNIPVRYLEEVCESYGIDFMRMENLIRDYFGYDGRNGQGRE